MAVRSKLKSVKLSHGKKTEQVIKVTKYLTGTEP